MRVELANRVWLGHVDFFQRVRLAIRVQLGCFYLVQHYKGDWSTITDNIWTKANLLYLCIHLHRSFFYQLDKHISARIFCPERDPRVWSIISLPLENARSDGVLVAGTANAFFAIAANRGNFLSWLFQYVRITILPSIWSSWKYWRTSSAELSSFLRLYMFAIQPGCFALISSQPDSCISQR